MTESFHELGKSPSHLPAELTGRAGPARKMVEIRAVGEEILDVMPEGFVFQYQSLWLSAVGRSVGGRPGLPERVVAPNVVAKANRSQPRTSTGQREHRGGAKRSKDVDPGGVEIAREGDLNFKRKMDRKLRAIAREIRVWREGGRLKGGIRRCSQCKRFGDEEWVYCPWDGKRMEESDR